MAERRMFTKKITDDDNFMALSSSAQALYFHLSMGADDDGFCNQINLAMFKAHASIQDLQALLEKRYLYQFENGVIVIKHWRMANALRKDRYTPTSFQEELARLRLKDNGAYTLDDAPQNETNDDKTDVIVERLPDGCHSVATCLPQDRIGKDSIDNIIKEKPLSKDNGKKKEEKKFVPPTLEEVIEYCQMRKSTVDPKYFYDYYNEANWIKENDQPVKSWKRTVVQWEKWNASLPQQDSKQRYFGRNGIELKPPGERDHTLDEVFGLKGD